MTVKNQGYTLRKPETSAEWEIVKRLLTAYRDEFNNDTCFSSFEEEMAHIEELYSRSGHIKIIAVNNMDGIIAGCVALQPFTPGIAEMKRLYVVPQHRGHHLGRQLAESIILHAVQAGYEKIYLDTMKEMVTAQTLYHSLGFEIIPAYDDQDLSRLICYGKILQSE